MKTTIISERRRERGIMLIECLAYIGMFFLVMGLGFKVFYACWDNAKGVKRNTEDITRALNAGERWRDEVRHATGTLRVESADDGEVTRIPQKTGEIDYRFAKDALWRRDGASGGWALALHGVKISRMASDARQHVTAFRWELALVTKRKDARLYPVFLFEAVPQIQFDL